MYSFSRKERAFLEVQRVGHMAQVGKDRLPHVTPLCHALGPKVLYIETGGASWKVRNLRGRPQVAYVVDEYTEEWGKLRGIRIQGTAEVLREGKEYQSAKRLLFRKFPYQFRKMGWKDGVNVVLKITPVKATAWGL